MKVVSLLVIAAIASGLVGCGGDNSSTPLIGTGPETVGTLSSRSESDPLVQDVTLIREAATSTEADEAFSGVYDLLNRAYAEKDVHRGASMIRAELPGLVSTYERAVPLAKRRVAEAQLKSVPGPAIRSFMVSTLDSNLHLLQEFRRNVARSRTTWAAVVLFGEKNNAEYRQYSARLDRLRGDLPPSQREALDLAAKELFGSR